MEQRLMLASDWRNPIYSFDVNADGSASPLDALLVINDLGRHIDEGSRPITGVSRPQGTPYLDPNGDGKISPLDALNVINELARPSPFILNEQGSRVAESSIVIGLGQETGTRTYRFEIDATFDTSDTSAGLEDTFAVYLKDIDGNNTTVIDRGVSGTSLFTLSGDTADFIPGLVRFDGTVVEIDLSSRPELDAARLVFQLINADGDHGSAVSLHPLANDVDPEGVVGIRLDAQPTLSDAADSLAADSLFVTSAIKPVFENIRYRSRGGVFEADLRVFNSGDPTGRDVIVAFPQMNQDDFQSTISGTLADGSPYISFRDAITSGGLDHHGQSRTIPVTIDAMPSALLLQTQTRTGGPNRAPAFSALSAVTVTPGESHVVNLFADDPDGDRVYFTTSTMNSGLPFTLDGNGTLTLHPNPNSIGIHEVVLSAKDGILSSTQVLEVTVAERSAQPTTFSGTVLDVDGTPLQSVPIEIGRFQGVTDNQGQFRIDLPSFTVPTESFEISVPIGDPYFDPLGDGNRSIELNRAGYDITTGTSASNPRQHPNLVSSFLDGSVVYGSSPDRATALRTNDGTGRLKTSVGNLLPLNDDLTFPDGVLENENSSRRDPQTLFAAGDVRANENPGLASLQTLLVREHNRRADELAAANPGLDGESLYQEARRWVGAIIQHITYNEFLPLLLGQNALGTYAGYDPDTDPSVSGLFSGAAFRFGHSTATSGMILLDESGQPLLESPISTRDAFFNPEPLKDLGLDPILRGMVAQTSEALDTQVIDDLRNFLFGPPGAGGLDLVSLNIQRGRDLGLPSYVDVRAQFGLEPVHTFADISSNVEVQARLAAVYGSVEQIDLWVGGLAEDHVAGAMLGETFHVIITSQFERLRTGDRFWYENGQFTADDLQAIRSTSMSSLIERMT